MVGYHPFLPVYSRVDLNFSVFSRCFFCMNRNLAINTTLQLPMNRNELKLGRRVGHSPQRVRVQKQIFVSALSSSPVMTWKWMSCSQIIKFVGFCVFSWPKLLVVRDESLALLNEKPYQVQNLHAKHWFYRRRNRPNLTSLWIAVILFYASSLFER